MTDPILMQGREREARFHAEAAGLAARVVLVPSSDSEEARRFDVIGAADLGSPAEKLARVIEVREAIGGRLDEWLETLAAPHRSP